MKDLFSIFPNIGPQLPQGFIPASERIRKAVERLNEDEGLTGNLNDDSARLLLAWAEGLIKNIYQPDETLPPAALNEDQVFGLVRAVNRLTGDQPQMSEAEFVQGLLDLLDTALNRQKPDDIPHPNKMEKMPVPSLSKNKKNWIILAALGGILLLVACCLLSGMTTFEQLSSILNEILVTPTTAGVEVNPNARGASTPTPGLFYPPTPSGKWYTLYFTTPTQNGKASVEDPAILQGLISAIDGAKKSLDVAIYELNLDPIGEAILRAVQRGVTVRIVTDSDSLKEDKTLITLAKKKVKIVPDERQAIMHNKFMVVDGKAVWTGSWNFTFNDTYRNNNNAIYIQSPELADNYTTEFEEMFVNKKFGPESPSNTPNPEIQIENTLVETCFAPEDGCGSKIIALVKASRSTIRFMAFSYTHNEIGKAMLERSKAGVNVSGVFETRGADTEYSEYNILKKAKMDVLLDGNPYTMHHKVIIIDDQVVVMGSFNFTANADESNDENMVIIHNPTIADSYVEEFQKVYDQAKNH